MRSKRAVMVLFHDTISPRHLLMLRSLKGFGLRVSVVAWKRREESRIPAACRDLVDKWYWIPVRAHVRGGIKILTRLPLFYYRLVRCISTINKVDLWILCHFWLLGFGFFLPGKKLYDASEMHSIDMSFHLPVLGRFFSSVVKFLEGVLTSRMGGVSTVDSKGGWLQRFYQRWNRNVEVIWNVPSKRDDPGDEEVHAFAKEYSGRRVVSFIGGLKDKKGFDVALHAASAISTRHRDVLFLFIGSIRGDEDAVYAMIRANNLENHIRLLQWLPYREMLAHLRYARVGLALYQNVAHYPLVSAGNGRKFFSYMQAGIPIIGPSFGEVGLAVKMADCGLLVDTGNVTEVSDAITQLLNSPKAAEMMGINGRKAFLEDFNWERQEPKFLSFVERIICS